MYAIPSLPIRVTANILPAIVVGDYLYIDGGEINFLDNGTFRHLPDNATYSIDLRASWNNRSVTINPIKKDISSLNYVSLWKDPTSKAFYSYGGEVTRALPPDQLPPIPPNAIWKFNADGNSGSWSQVSMASNSIFPSLVRPAGGVGAYGDGLGLLLGGYATSISSLESRSYQGLVPTPGMLSYNMSSGVWANNSATDFSTYGTAILGQMQYVPNFGEQGLFVVVGGQTANRVSWQDRGSNLLPFRNIYIYDPASASWHNQTASGSIPNPRDRFCSVGVQGENGTYEVFIYGGHVAPTEGQNIASKTDEDVARNLALDEVFVLSLPGFNWQKANYTATHPRIAHSCNLVGKRQMAVIGGVNPATRNDSDQITTPDVWTNGIGIFDLSAMQWTDRYNANADNYTTPAAVRGWYRQNGRYPSQWDDPRVRAYFVRDATPNNSTSGSTNASRGDRPTESGKSSNTPAIVGGVVGGIAALALLGAGLWFFFRRRRRSYQQARSHKPDSPAAEIDGCDKVPSGATYQSAQLDPKAELAAGDSIPLSSSKKPRADVYDQPAVEVENNSRFELHG
ncbi:MAG: hypothetical protein M1816_007107 [Peltula sp. TS41687]|nr:MAG: hypothetical protein M1816_007107 [Peltula sp. TS41687]